MTKLERDMVRNAAVLKMRTAASRRFWDAAEKVVQQARPTEEIDEARAILRRVIMAPPKRGTP